MRSTITEHTAIDGVRRYTRPAIAWQPVAWRRDSEPHPLPEWRARAADPIGRGATMLSGKDLTGAVRV